MKGKTRTIANNNACGTKKNRTKEEKLPTTDQRK